MRGTFCLEILWITYFSVSINFQNESSRYRRRLHRSSWRCGCWRNRVLHQSTCLHASWKDHLFANHVIISITDIAVVDVDVWSPDGNTIRIMRSFAFSYFWGRLTDYYYRLESALFLFLPGNGTILPFTGAILCHYQAKNDTSGERFLQDYPSDSLYGFLLHMESFACRNPTLGFTLHSSPFCLKPR